jgi:hypothetical protein
MTRYKPGDRVSDPFFGDGVVVDIIYHRGSEVWWYKVKWDQIPPYEYNLGKNPALWIPRDVMA